MSSDAIERLDRIEASLKALVMLKVREIQLTEDKVRAESRSVEALLFQAGFASQTEIGQIVNKTQQAVGQRLKAEGVL